MKKFKIVQKDETRYPFLYEVKVGNYDGSYIVSKEENGEFDIELSDCEKKGLDNDILFWIEEEV